MDDTQLIEPFGCGGLPSRCLRANDLLVNDMHDCSVSATGAAAGCEITYALDPYQRLLPDAVGQLLWRCGSCASRQCVGQPICGVLDLVARAFARTEEFKEIVRDMGLVDYWREFGWNDYCRPVGEDDSRNAAGSRWCKAP